MCSSNPIHFQAGLEQQISPGSIASRLAPSLVG
jgi:hypothetical protein